MTLIPRTTVESDREKWFPIILLLAQQHQDRLDSFMASAARQLADTLDHINQSPPRDLPAFTEDDAVQHSTHKRGEQLMNRFLLCSSDAEFRDMFRLTKATFLHLNDWVNDHAPLKPRQHACSRQQLMIFLWICGHNQTQSQASIWWGHSTTTIGRIINSVLAAMLSLHDHVVRPMDVHSVAPELLNSRRYPYFSDCIGSIDGTFIHARVRKTEACQFYCYKKFSAQNVFAAVNHNGTFSYILAGSPGRMSDRKILVEAERDGFMAPEGKYWLSDAGFNLAGGYLCPYPNVRYGRKERGDPNLQPKTKEELFNLRHSSLRVTIEMAFGRLKRRWKIVRATAPEYNFTKQTDLVYALTALQNFIALVRHEPLHIEWADNDEDDDMLDQIEDSERRWVGGYVGTQWIERELAVKSRLELPPCQAAEGNDMLFDMPRNIATKEECERLRDEIATAMWEDYCNDSDRESLFSESETSESRYSEWTDEGV